MSWWFQYLPVNGASVALQRVTWYCRGVSSARHCWSVLATLAADSPSPWAPAAAPPAPPLESGAASPRGAAAPRPPPSVARNAASASGALMAPTTRPDTAGARRARWAVGLRSAPSHSSRLSEPTARVRMIRAFSM
ncbi:hypothetical protein FJ250_04070 [bacterium]|nr:hypothetical protein [bacterium]